MSTANLTYRDMLAGCPVLITGGAGFIGSHLAGRLVDLGAEVRVIDDLSTGHIENLPQTGIDFHNASILDEQVLRDAVAGCRFVFHQAAMVSVPLSVEEPEMCCQINIIGTQRVLEAACDARVERFIFASSAAVYGDEPSLPSTERDPVDPRSPYAASKAAGEAIVAAFGHCYELTTVSLRYFNIFGERQDPSSHYSAVIAAFTSALARGEQPKIFGDGQQTRDFTYIANAVHANLLSATCPHDITGQVINIGTGRSVSLLELLKKMCDAFGVDVEPTFAPPRAGDVMHSRADITKARDLLGYEPIVDIDTGLKRTINDITRAR